MDPVLPEFLIFYKRSQNSHILMEILQVFKMLAPKYHHFFFFFYSSCQHLQVRFSPWAASFRW